ncbi:hypothetical protein RRG08_065718 [Elysia crispata]|uniref:Uncharacterized protein n=1 Tax=Elysia crispata TaxID=231223 RepID=A0AAE1DAP6_9GAST|nr:hypothetical protein RRG08_065718 [Elysia crispata]
MFFFVVNLKKKKNEVGRGYQPTSTLLLSARFCDRYVKPSRTTNRATPAKNLVSQFGLCQVLSLESSLGISGQTVPDIQSRREVRWLKSRFLTNSRCVISENQVTSFYHTD